MIKNKTQKKGQVWIETVLYTLIALALIGLVLGFVMPKISQTKDKLIVEQTITMLSLLDDKINAAAATPGSTRIFDFNIKRGQLYINTSSNSIVFSIDDLSKAYSEPGVDIPNGQIIMRSETGQKNSQIFLTLKYNSYNITYNGAKEDKVFTTSSVPYKIQIKNNGFAGLTQIDIVPLS